jgi:hypothetical protein
MFRVSSFEIDLTANNKLKYLDISDCGSVLRLYRSDFKFGDNKKTLEEFHFVYTVYNREHFSVNAGFLDLTEFINLKKIGYS